MRGSGRLAAVLAGALGMAAALGAAGCGGGARQDADEPAGTWRLDVVGATFPAHQSVSDPSRLVVSVRNASRKPAPNVAVTIATTPRGGGGGGDGATGEEMSGAEQAFSMDIEDPAAADRSRPIWVVDAGPPGGDTAYTNTWALGRLKAGETRRFVWRLTAVRPGRYRVSYAVFPGLTGKARVRDGTGQGAFKVAISDLPPQAGVDAAGNVVREPAR
jgi:hypothetical protein